MTEPKPRFRPVAEADQAAILEWLADQAELFRVYPAAVPPFDRHQLQTLLHEREESTILEMAGEAAGFANLYHVRPRAHAFIGNVIIAPRWRGQGLGTELLRHMLDRIRARHIPEARLSVFADNTPALRLYHRHGFTPYAMEERTDPHGRMVILLHLKKTVASDEGRVARKT